MQILVNFDFPGNIRELENAIEYAIAFTQREEIRKDDLPNYLVEGKRAGVDAPILPILPLREAKSQFEKGVIIAALIEAEGNISEAARLLEVHRQNLQQKIRLLGIDVDSLILRK
jgi:DNA-binding NtrC family response regulator